MMMRAILLLAVSIAIGTLAGCAASPTAKFYTLSPAAASEGGSAGTVPGEAISVLVAPVTVPETVDRPQLVARVGVNEVRLAEFARWAEPLKSEIQRAVAGDLAQLLADARVSTTEQGKGSTGGYRVRIDVLRFESSLGETATVEALWSVRPPNGAAVLSGRTFAQERVAGKDYGAMVAAHSRNVATLSRDIATAIRQSGAP